MELYERFRQRRINAIHKKIAAQAGKIAIALSVDALSQPGPYQYSIGYPPVGYEPEGYLHHVRDAVVEQLNERGLTSIVAYDSFRTHLACADGGAGDFTSWPEEVIPELTIVFSQVK